MSIITKLASTSRSRNPLFARIFLGVSGVTGSLAAWNFLKSKTTEHDVDFRKSQLSKPIYRLTEEEMVNPPWNENNIKEWLYRRVEVTGRPIHRLQCMIPRNVSGQPGFECVVPLVARQNEERTYSEGLLFARGYIPYRFKSIPNRYKVEDSSPQTFVGFVSKLEDLQSHGFLDGNAVGQGRLNYTHANLDDLATSSGLANKKQAKVAVIERLYELGDLNERHSKRYSHDCDGALDYPYYKTEVGALQAAENPWDYRNHAGGYFAASLFSFLVGASLF